jgi:hypothetical protein
MQKPNMMRLIFGLFCSILWLFSNALLAQDSNVLKTSLVKYIAKGQSLEAIPFAEQRAEMLKAIKGKK